MKKFVYFRQYIAVKNAMPATSEESFTLAVIPFKRLPYAEFRTFFAARGNNLIGLEVVVEMKINLPVKYADDDDGTRYAYWKWYKRKDGEQNVWVEVSKGKLYRHINFLDGKIEFKN